MKYNVKFACGHEEVVSLVGKVSERERRIAWMERECLCSECYRKMKEEEMAIKFDEVKMLYRDYKTGEYANCKTKPGSYNADEKTIVVYVAKN